MRERIAAVVVVCAVAAVVAGGFLLIGSPAAQRRAELDRIRVADLGGIVFDLHERYREHHAGPPARLTPGRIDVPDWVANKTDPVTGRPYGYARLGATAYRLCAEFAADSRREPGGEAMWPHRAGRTCYRFDVRDEPPSGDVKSRPE